MLTAVNLICVVALWLVERHVAECHWLTTLIVYAPQHPVGVPTALLVAWSLWRRRRKVLVANLVALAVFVFPLLGFSVPLGWLARPSGVLLRVMTWNIHHAPQGAASIMEQVNQSGADVLCFQEAEEHPQRDDPVLRLKWLLYGWHIAHEGELTTYSRHPLVSHRLVYLRAGNLRPALETVLDIEGTQVRVLNVHLSTAAYPASLLHHTGSTPNYLRHTAQVRTEQVDGLLRVTAGARGPLVVAGDFNTPPRGLLYLRLARRFQDAFRAGGWGLGYTFKSSRLLWRIDYVFLGSGVAATSCYAPTTDASDHRPVVAELRVSAGREAR